MKISEFDVNVMRTWTIEQIWDTTCEGIVDDGATAEVALIFGGLPLKSIERALAAAQLYREGRVKKIMPSGGVEWEYNGEKLSEANLMARVLRENGVPDEAIILENEARTTKENIIYATLQIVRSYKQIVDSVILITSVWHMKRAVALSEALLPRKIKIHTYPSYPEGGGENWLKDKGNHRAVYEELGHLKKLVMNGDVEDIEINF